MAKFTIVGYEHNAGVSKKTNQPYDIHILHVVASRPMKGVGKVGNSVATIPINAEAGILTQIPSPGEVWEIDFNLAGRVEDAYPAE